MKTLTSTNQQIIQRHSDDLHDNIVDQLISGRKLAVIKAPPGSGKTFTLLRIVRTLIDLHGWKVAIAAQTNNQANDIARQFGLANPDLLMVRIGAAGSAAPSDFPPAGLWVNSFGDAPDAPGLFVSTTAKWAASGNLPFFDLLAVDEAWQMAWADLMRCADASPRYLLIGDPGQIAPVTSVDVSRWGTSRRAPHKAAPSVVFADPQFKAVRVVGNLPACRRLPAESVPYIKPFYDFDFDAFAQPGDRIFRWAGETISQNGQGYELLFEKLEKCEPLLLTISTAEDGPPAEVDYDLAKAIRNIVAGLICEDVLIREDARGNERRVSETDIGITSSHRAMNGAIRRAFDGEFNEVRIDTPERWQGLEKPIMIAVHPLSGVTEPSDFDLATGRLCVMASRHKVAMIFVSRDHVGHTIENVIPAATQPPGEPDVVGAGRQAHLEFWELLVANDRVIALP